MPEALHGKVLHSPHPHARILRLDTSKAEALPGVRAVITAADFPPLGQAGEVPMGELPINWEDLRRMVIAEGKTLWAGHPVAAVAATDADIAQEALDLVEVEYEDLGVVRTAIGWMGAPWPMWYIRSHAHLLSMGAMTPRRGSMARFLRNAVPGISLDRAAQTSLS